MVQFEDGSIKAQMGLPDMKLPIQYAMAYPDRISNEFPRYDFTKAASLTFEPPDTKTFRNLALATDAMFRGGNAPAVLNAANEIAVYGFLRNKIGFLEMTDLIEKTMARIEFIPRPGLQDYFESDAAARNFAATLLDI
jgi:1-deoxy-D-xylulose-5-phosphate reductoisomerase